MTTPEAVEEAALEETYERKSLRCQVGTCPGYGPPCERKATFAVIWSCVLALDKRRAMPMCWQHKDLVLLGRPTTCCCHRQEAIVRDIIRF